MNRKELPDYSTVIANRVEKIIPSELSNDENISASFDGWTGMDTRQILGVSIQWIIQNKLKWYIINFMNIEDACVSAVGIGYLLTKSFRDHRKIGRFYKDYFSI